MIGQAYAMAPRPGATTPGSAGGLGSFVPLILIFFIFYFLLIRPQQIRQKKQRELLQNLKRGDEVVTNGGIHGTIVRIKEDVLTLKVAEKVEIQVSRSAIAHCKKK